MISEIKNNKRNMAKTKKHIAVQNEFDFVEESSKQINTMTNTEQKPIDATNYHRVQNDPSVKKSDCTETTLTYSSMQIAESGVITPLDTPTTSVGTLIETPTLNPGKKCIPPKIFSRNEYGLFDHIDYLFKDDGYVNWRAMIPKEYLYVGDNIKNNPVRREMFEKKYGKKPEKIDLSLDKVEDDDLLITLAGIRYLATLRGYEYVEFKTLESSNQAYAVVNCSIAWFNNYETIFDKDKKYYDTTRFDAVGCASTDNTSGHFRNYLPEIASNRAFCRAVRNFLNINVVSDEEVHEKKDEPKPQTSTGVTPYGNPVELLTAKLQEKGISFQKLKELMVKKDKEWSSYEAVLDVPNVKIFDVLGRMKKKEKQQAEGPVEE
jgi:hypothetical protein